VLLSLKEEYGWIWYSISRGVVIRAPAKNYTKNRKLEGPRFLEIQIIFITKLRANSMDLKARASVLFLISSLPFLSTQISLFILFPFIWCFIYGLIITLNKLIVNWKILIIEYLQWPLYFNGWQAGSHLTKPLFMVKGLAFSRLKSYINPYQVI